MGKLRNMDLINRFKGNKTLLNGAFFSLFSFINRGFVFLLLLILANYISPAEYGYLSLFSTIVVLTGYIICLSSEGYLTISYFQEGQDGVKYTFSVILIIGILITSLFVIIILIGGDSLSTLLDLPQNILLIAVLISFFTALANVNLDYFRIQERVNLYGVFSCGNALLNFIITILLIKYFSMSWEGRAYAQFGCSLLFGFFCIFFFISKKFYSLNIKDKIVPIVYWALPLIPLHATNFLRQGVDRYIINYHHTIADVGLFSFALNIANAITMIGFGFNQSFSVDIYKILSDSITNEEKLRKIKKLIRLVLLVFILATIIVTMVCYFILPILLPNYAMSINYFVILSIYAFFVCYYLAFTNFLFYFKNTKAIMYWSVGSSTLHMLLSLFLTQYSLYLTSAVYCISQALFAFGIQWQANRELSKRLLK